MPKFSNKSKERLATCHDKLQAICNEAIRITDFTVLEGHRGEERQNELYKKGSTKAVFGASKHNFKPSLAVDLAPYPIDWEDTERFAELAGVIKAVAFKYGVNITWGGDWHSFKDMPHYEIEGD